MYPYEQKRALPSHRAQLQKIDSGIHGNCIGSEAYSSCLLFQNKRYCHSYMIDISHRLAI